MTTRHQPRDTRPNMFIEGSGTDSDALELIEEPAFQVFYDDLPPNQRAIAQRSEEHVLAQALYLYKAELAKRSLATLIKSVGAAYVGVLIEFEGMTVRVIGRACEQEATAFFHKQKNRLDGYLTKLQDGAAHRIIGTAIANVDPPKVIEEKQPSGLFGWFKKEKVVYIERPRGGPTAGSGAGNLLWPEGFDPDD